MHLLILVVSLLASYGQARFYGNYEPNLAAPVIDDIGVDELQPLEDEGGIIPDGVGSDRFDSNEINQKLLYLTSKHAKENDQWTSNSDNNLKSVGRVAGVAASQDFLYIFHRANVTWNEESFDPQTNVYKQQQNPIADDTVFAVDLDTSEVMFSWGKNRFFMPHGISVDPQGNVWLTDVALHQVFRFKKNNFEQVDLLLGERFVPGTDDNHFCKPTDVAIASSGVAYISDGYCNSRIMMFSASGKYITEFGDNDKMRVPHSVSLLEIEDLLCVADRENGRILCYSAGLRSENTIGQLLFEVDNKELHEIYAIAHLGDIILALNGGPKQTVGVSVDLATEQVVDVWAPTNGTFTDAHDLTLAHDQQSFFVCQLTTGHSKVIKFDLVDPTLTN